MELARYRNFRQARVTLTARQSCTNKNSISCAQADIREKMSGFFTSYAAFMWKQIVELADFNTVCQLWVMCANTPGFCLRDSQIPKMPGFKEWKEIFAAEKRLCSRDIIVGPTFPTLRAPTTRELSRKSTFWVTPSRAQ